jgi:hypothetical protein
MRGAIEALSWASEDSHPRSGAHRRSSDSAANVSAVGVVERLRREDFDGYERGLKVRRWVALSIVPFVLLALAVGGFFFIRHDKPRVLDEEVEPNDDPATANAVESGRSIRGHIGQRRSPEESDRDFYHLSVTPPNDRLTVEVTGIPEMDLILQLYDGAGKLVAESETGAEGDAEAIFDQRVQPGEYYVQVREVWVSGENATENVSDWYSLKVLVDHAPATEEVEPNGDPALANTVAASNVMVGRLTHPGDVDCFLVPPPIPSAVGAAVTGLPGVDMRIALLPQTARVGQKGTRTVDGAHTGEGARIDKAPWQASSGPPVVCVERRDHPVPRGQEHVAHTEHLPHVALPSRSATYNLTIDAAR